MPHEKIRIDQTGVALGIGLAGGAMSSFGPSAFPQASTWVWQTAFSASCAIFIVGLLLLVLQPKNLSRRFLDVWPQYSMFVGFGIFLFGLVAFLVKNVEGSQRLESGNQVKVDLDASKREQSSPPSFKEIFDKDFESGGVGGKVPLTYKDGSGHELPVRVLLDFPSRVKYLAVFLSPPDEGYHQAVMVIRQCDEIIALFDRSIRETMSSPGDTSASSSNDLIFSKLIYFYMDSDLSLQQQASIETIAKSNGLSVQMRGLAYYTLHWHEPRFSPIGQAK